MKNKSRIFSAGILAAIAILYLMGCSSARKDYTELASAGEEIRVYEVFGMDCPGCHGGLENLANKIEGVKTTKANWEEQRLIVVLYPDANPSDEVIFGAIKNANFTPGKRIR